MTRSPSWLRLAIAASLARPTATQAQSACRPADQTSQLLIKELTYYATTTNPKDVAMRDSLRILPVAPSAVTLVTTASVCNKANTAYKAYQGGAAGFSNRVYVVKIGTRYAVLDPTYPTVQTSAYNVLIVDSQFRPLASYGSI